MGLRQALRLGGCVVAFAALLALPSPDQDSASYPDRLDGLRTAAATLRGEGVRSDLAADYVGARAILRGDDGYPLLGPALEEVGIEWALNFRSPHPPTAEALALPIAGLSWPLASQLWAWAMLVALGVSAWALGASPSTAALLAPLSLLWPPAAWSLSQLTPLWLLGVSLAWRWRERPLRAGLAVGLAATTKLVPVLALAPWLLRKRLGVVAGACLAFVPAVAALLVLSPGVFGRYAGILGQEARSQALRTDNGSLLALTADRFGPVGLLLAVALVAAVAARATRLTATEPLSPVGYGMWVWLPVALLPITWVYSLLPLAPAFVFVLRARGVGALAAGLAIALPLALPPFRTDSAPLIGATVALVGVGLLAATVSARVHSRSGASRERLAEGLERAV